MCHRNVEDRALVSRRYSNNIVGVTMFNVHLLVAVFVHLWVVEIHDAGTVSFHYTCWATAQPPLLSTDYFTPHSTLSRALVVICQYYYCRMAAGFPAREIAINHTEDSSRKAENFSAFFNVCACTVRMLALNEIPHRICTRQRAVDQRTRSL